MYGYIHLSHLWMWELDHKESWAPKNWFFWTVVLEKMLESPLDCMEFKPVNPKGNQSWIFIGRTDTEAKTPILWPPDEKWLIGKGPDVGKDWRQEEKGMTEDEMVGWHHWLNGHESEQAPADGDCSHEIKRCLLLGRKAMTDLDSILKSRDITLPTKVHIRKAMVFPVVMYGCLNWTIKKAEDQKIDAFKLWCWRRLLITTRKARK